MKLFLLTALATTLLLLLSCNGEEDRDLTPELSMSGEIVPFEATDVLQKSAPQQLGFIDINLDETISIAVTENFEVSLNDNTYARETTLPGNQATQSTLYIRFAPGETSTGIITGTLTITHPNVTPITISLSGEGVPGEPTIVVDNIENFGTVAVGKSSSVTPLKIQGYKITNAVNITTEGAFEISLLAQDYSNELELSAELINEGTLIYLRMVPEQIGTNAGSLTIASEGTATQEIPLEGTGEALIHNYRTFNATRLGFGDGLSQSSEETFTLHDETTTIRAIRMYVKLECPATVGCNIWDVFAHVQVKDPNSGEWLEMGRYITPYGVDNSQWDRGYEIDVTDFKSLLQGEAELRSYIEVWGSDGWNLSVEFDFEEGEPDYPYYNIARVIQYNRNSLEGVPYGVDASDFDLTKSLTLPANTEAAHLRTIITGWGHATPTDEDGRPCAEWCFRTHQININSAPTFSHAMEPMGCSQNPTNNQRGNWQPDRAGWCPGMAVPVRIDDLGNNRAGQTLAYEYEFESWTSNGGTTSGQTGSFYAISSFVVVKSNTEIDKPVVIE